MITQNDENFFDASRTTARSRGCGQPVLERSSPLAMTSGGLRTSPDGRSETSGAVFVRRVAVCECPETRTSGLLLRAPEHHQQETRTFKRKRVVLIRAGSGSFGPRRGWRLRRNTCRVDGRECAAPGGGQCREGSSARLHVHPLASPRGSLLLLFTEKGKHRYPHCVPVPYATQTRSNRGESHRSSSTAEDRPRRASARLGRMLSPRRRYVARCWGWPRAPLRRSVR